MLRPTLNISGVGRSISGDVDLHVLCFGLGEVSNACRLRIEAPRRQRTLSIDLGGGAKPKYHTPETTTALRLSRCVCAWMRVFGRMVSRMVYGPALAGSPATIVVRMPATPMFRIRPHVRASHQPRPLTAAIRGMPHEASRIFICAGTRLPAGWWPEDSLP